MSEYDKNKNVTYKMKKRLLFVYGLFLAVFILIVGRLAYLQIVRSNTLKLQALNSQMRDTVINAKRGAIFDRKKRELAISATAYTIYATPNEIKKDKQITKSDIKYMAQKLSVLLDKKEEKIYKLITKNSAYEIVAKRIEKEKADKIRDLRLSNGLRFPGIRVLEDAKRYYPYGNFASQVIGFTGDDGTGLQGLESEYNRYLKGIPGRLILESDVYGKEVPLGTQEYVKPKDGDSLVLTIDEVIQHYAESALEQAVSDTGSKRGAVIVMDPRNGEILALANKPDYDLNKPFEPANEAQKMDWKNMTQTKKSELLQKIWRNFAVSDTYEPGSPFKIITASGALEEGSVKPSDRFVCNGSMMVLGKTIHCAKATGHGPQDFVQGLENSCNVVFMQTGLKLGGKKLVNYTKAFGLDQKTGIDLPGEASGILHNGPMTDLDTAVMSFGQSIQVTPIGMMSAICAVANDGKLMRPHLLKEVVSPNGKTVKTVQPEVVRQVISKNTANELSDMLEKVVSVGTGKNGKIDGYKIAGKTGTSEKQPRNHGLYVASFAGFAPVGNPRIAVMVILDEPSSGSHFGGVIAAPVFKQVMADSLNYLGIKKSDGSANEKQVTVSNYIGKKYITVANELKANKINYIVYGSGNMVVDQIPRPGAKVFKDTKLLIYLKEHKTSNKVTVPDLKGKTPEEVNKIVSSLGLKLKLIGYKGNVYNQSPEAGSEVLPNSDVIVTLQENKPSTGVEDVGD